jgi:hypothetical protein
LLCDAELAVWPSDIEQAQERKSMGIKGFGWSSAISEELMSKWIWYTPTNE